PSKRSPLHRSPASRTPDSESHLPALHESPPRCRSMRSPSRWGGAQVSSSLHASCRRPCRRSLPRVPDRRSTTPHRPPATVGPPRERSSCPPVSPPKPHVSPSCPPSAPFI